MHVLCFCGWVEGQKAQLLAFLRIHILFPLPTHDQNSDATLLLFSSSDVGVNFPPGNPQLDMSTVALVACSRLTLEIPWTLSSSILIIFQAWILKWLPISFSRESSWPRVWTWVSCIAGLFFTNCTTKGSLVRAQKAFYFYLLVINLYHLSFHPHKLQDVWPCQLLGWFIKTFSYIKGSPNLKLFANDPPSVWDFSASESRMSSTSFFRYLFNCPIIREYSWPSSIKQ